MSVVPGGVQYCQHVFRLALDAVARAVAAAAAIAAGVDPDGMVLGERLFQEGEGIQIPPMAPCTSCVGAIS
jgi:hypothetical protein